MIRFRGLNLLSPKHRLTFAYVVYCESDSEAISTHPLLRSPVLLHQSDDYGTLVVVVVVGMLQRNAILRVVTESLCAKDSFAFVRD